jgi:hypothetical protein
MMATSYTAKGAIPRFKTKEARGNDPVGLFVLPHNNHFGFAHHRNHVQVT